MVLDLCTGTGVSTQIQSHEYCHNVLINLQNWVPTKTMRHARASVQQICCMTIWTKTPIQAERLHVPTHAALSMRANILEDVYSLTPGRSDWRYVCIVWWNSVSSQEIGALQSVCVASVTRDSVTQRPLFPSQFTSMASADVLVAVLEEGREKQVNIYHDRRMALACPLRFDMEDSPTANLTFFGYFIFPVLDVCASISRCQALRQKGEYSG